MSREPGPHCKNKQSSDSYITNIINWLHAIHICTWILYGTQGMEIVFNS